MIPCQAAVSPWWARRPPPSLARSRYIPVPTLRTSCLASDHESLSRTRWKECRLSGASNRLSGYPPIAHREAGCFPNDHCSMNAAFECQIACQAAGSECRYMDVTGPRHGWWGAPSPSRRNSCLASDLCLPRQGTDQMREVPGFPHAHRSFIGKPAALPKGPFSARAAFPALIPAVPSTYRVGNRSTSRTAPLSALVVSAA